MLLVLIFPCRLVSLLIVLTSKTHFPPYIFPSYFIQLFPKVDRGFFKPGTDWACYRRNYFQISSSFTVTNTPSPNQIQQTPASSSAPLSHHRFQLPCFVEDNGLLRTVTGFLINVMSRSDNGSREIDLIQHTAKRDKGPV